MVGLQLLFSFLPTHTARYGRSNSTDLAQSKCISSYTSTYASGNTRDEPAHSMKMMMFFLFFSHS
jgi:hypothetical protein